MTDQPHKPFHSTPKQWRQLKPVARGMRHEPTPAEEVLWQALRNRKVAGAKFRRQFTIDRFIVDFYCAEAKLVIEVDGEIHRQQEAEDQVRQTFLESQGFRVLRFENEEVLKRIDTVLTHIGAALQQS